MKLLHVICTVNPTGGGPIEGVKQLSAVNLAHGHFVEVVSLDSPECPHVKAFPVPVHAMGPGWMKYGYSPRLLPWLHQNAKNYDAVVVNGIWQYHSFAAWKALHGIQVPYVLFTHGMLDPWFKTTYPLKHLKKLMYWPWAEYRVLRDAMAVLFTCEDERILARQSFPHLYRCNEVVVKYGTAGPRGDAHIEVESFYAKFPEIRGKRLAIFLGRLHEKKGCDLLIQAFAKVMGANADWQLVMCGPDQTSWKPHLESLARTLNISGRITWAGMVSGNVKWGALRASEVFVLPSHQENFGIVVAEALACGVPVLISNKVNIWREIEKDNAGIVGEDSLAGTCSLLSAWMEMTDEQRRAMRMRAAECFRQRFEIHQAAASLITALEGNARIKGRGKEQYA